MSANGLFGYRVAARRAGMTISGRGGGETAKDPPKAGYPDLNSGLWDGWMRLIRGLSHDIPPEMKGDKNGAETPIRRSEPVPFLRYERVSRQRAYV